MIDIALFSKRVKECRENIGLTVRELADMVGTSGANISRYETGKHGAGSDILGKWLMYLMLTPRGLWVQMLINILIVSFQQKKIPVVGTIAAGFPYHSRRIYN